MIYRIAFNFIGFNRPDCGIEIRIVPNMKSLTWYTKPQKRNATI